MTSMAVLKLASSRRGSGHHPVAPTTQVKPGVADKKGPGTNVVPGTNAPPPLF